MKKNFVTGNQCPARDKYVHVACEFAQDQHTWISTELQRRERMSKLIEIHNAKGTLRFGNSSLTPCESRINNLSMKSCTVKGSNFLAGISVGLTVGVLHTLNLQREDRLGT